jgi:hypothetical protein
MHPLTTGRAETVLVHEHHVQSSQVVLHHSLASLASLLSLKCALLQNSWRGARLPAGAAGTAYTPPNTRRPTVHYLQQGQGPCMAALTVRSTRTLGRMKASRAARGEQQAMREAARPASRSSAGERALRVTNRIPAGSCAPPCQWRGLLPTRAAGPGEHCMSCSRLHALAELPPGPTRSCCKIDASTVTADLPSAPLPKPTSAHTPVLLPRSSACGAVSQRVHQAPRPGPPRTLAAPRQRRCRPAGPHPAPRTLGAFLHAARLRLHLQEPGLAQHDVAQPHG